jgi:glycosyltransferase involved in cell wall biosynthesis
MNIVLCSITREKNQNNTLLDNSLQKIGDVEVYTETGNNGTNIKGLSKFYNECLEKFSDRDYLVFVHDDVEIIFSDLSYQVTAAMEKFDVAGVAGCINPKILEKNLWHWMGETHSNLRGFAGHSRSSNDFVVTSYGPTPARVVLLDGVFLAVNVKKLKTTNTKFDEQFNFHHYDIDFSLACNKNKLKLGVWPFIINHRSPGLANFHEDWLKSNELFVNKWKKV